MTALPALGIINAADRPHQNMVAVVFGNPDALKWSYVAPGSGRTKSLTLDNLDTFTPLHHFGIKYGMTSDGRLHLRRFSISIAKTPDGFKRDWQGADDCILDVMPVVAAKVWGAVRLRHGAVSA